MLLFFSLSSIICSSSIYNLIIHFDLIRIINAILTAFFFLTNKTFYNMLHSQYFNEQAFGLIILLMHSQ